MSTETMLCRPQALADLIRDMLMAHGSARPEATHVGAHLVEASLSGHDSHGVIRILRYCDWLTRGLIVPNAELTLVADLGGLRQFDGGSGLGQWVAHRATEQGIAAAKAQGTAIILLRRAGHIGRVGAFAEQAAAAGLASVFFTNVAGSRLVAPFGAASKAGSTAPVTIGVPNPKGADFILDFATSLVAEGKVNVAAKFGRSLPPGALIDGQGEPSSDPVALYGDTVNNPAPTPGAGEGALTAFGLHKGSGLMLACELLGGALTGNGANGPDDPPFGNGFAAFFIDPARLDGPDAVQNGIAAYLEHVQGLKPAKGHEKVQIPGDPERALREQRGRDGLPLSRGVVDDIVAYATRLGVDTVADHLAMG